MNINLRYRGLNAHATWQSLVDEQLDRLQGLTHIESAQVVLERQREIKPAFRVHMLLAVPGPDIHAAATDHTLYAALLKVTKSLLRQIEHRKSRQAARLKSNQQMGFLPNHRAGTLVGQRA